MPLNTSINPLLQKLEPMLYDVSVKPTIQTATALIRTCGDCVHSLVGNPDLDIPTDIFKGLGPEMRRDILAGFLNTLRDTLMESMAKGVDTAIAKQVDKMPGIKAAKNQAN